MSETKWTKGPWKAFNMIHAETGERMTPDEVGEYVANAMRQRPECDDFLFISAEKADGEYDVCHVGNGADGPFNAALISAAPDLYAALDEATKDLVAAQVNARRAAKRDAAWEGVAELIQPSIDRARAALAKARGES